MRVYRQSSVVQVSSWGWSLSGPRLWLGSKLLEPFAASILQPEPTAAVAVVGTLRSPERWGAVVVLHPSDERAIRIPLACVAGAGVGGRTPKPAPVPVVSAQAPSKGTASKPPAQTGPPAGD